MRGGFSGGSGHRRAPAAPDSPARGSASRRSVPARCLCASGPHFGRPESRGRPIPHIAIPSPAESRRGLSSGGGDRRKLGTSRPLRASPEHFHPELRGAESSAGPLRCSPSLGTCREGTARALPRSTGWPRCRSWSSVLRGSGRRGSGGGGRGHGSTPVPALRSAFL